MSYRQRFLQLALDVQALRFGEFTLKSGRASPYFFNAGRFDSGAALAELSVSYAEAIAAAGLEAGRDFNLVFGPAYKGIPLATALVCEYARRGFNLPLAFNRKQVKSHGEGGQLIGAPLAHKRVLIVDDVITAGTAITEALAIIRAAGGIATTVAIALDREETMQDVGIQTEAPGRRSAAQGITAEQGLRVVAIAGLSDLLAFTDKSSDLVVEHKRLDAYRIRYGCDLLG